MLNWWMMERGNPLFALKEEHTRFNHVSLVNTSTSFWKKKKITIERRNPFVCRQRGAQQFVIGDDETESDMSLGSRSFLNKVNDQVRKRQKRSSMSVTEDSEKHSVIWGMFMSSTLESSVFMEKNYSDIWHSIKNTKDLTMNQMFDVSAKLVSEQDEICGVKTIDWENSSWKYLSLIGDEQIINLQRTKVYVFSDSVLCLGKMNENPRSNTAWEQRLEWFKSSSEYRILDRIDGEPMEFEWNIFPGFNTLQLSQEVQEFTVPALELWDPIVSVFGNVSQISDRSGQPDSDVKKHHKSQRRIDVMKDIDVVPSNVQSARQEALLYVFEDNEDVIKMIIKGRSPTKRHVSRTHRVALDWLFDRINLDSKIQIKYNDTKNQLADMLTKGNFTRDEWNHLLNLKNISHFSSTVSFAAMAKRSQHDSGEERVTAKSRPMMSLIARVPSNVSSSTSVSPGKRSYGNQNPWSTIVEKE